MGPGEGRFADDQFQDTIGLVAALATRLRTAGSGFAAVDDENARRFLDDVLRYGQFVDPGAR
ncbi:MULTISPECIES: hypothetical protein [unclassified Streptomyces]|uniref:hypothetical protein n=1 Tax=unclassified Streptomyces TaxID=2593676 RepID=UPI002030846E|nr:MULTISPECIES: hypothetical protein [unclassified Streptomyces]MCM1967916.1 hypothetical protein [Streptomyces sp. G1]MCX5128310.1 hypothetical protein [Streptomyces sp. NBC_00347]MCX5300810.1 hypothetical protein [Streptomyces sp. NBC_00193]